MGTGEDVPGGECHGQVLEVELSIGPRPWKGSSPLCPCPFQDSPRKRSLRRPPALRAVPQPREDQEESQKVPELSAHTPACPAPPEARASSGSPVGQLGEPTSGQRRPTPSGPARLLSPGLFPRGGGRWPDVSEDSPAGDSGPEPDSTPAKFLPSGSARTTQERLERAFRRQGSQPLPLR